MAKEETPFLSVPKFVPVDAFYASLKEDIVDHSRAFRTRNLDQRLLCIVSFFNKTQPFIKESFADEIVAEIKVIESLASRKTDTFQKRASNMLWDLERKIFRYSKHILMPQNIDESEEEVDWEKFMR